MSEAESKSNCPIVSERDALESEIRRIFSVKDRDVAVIVVQHTDRPEELGATQTVANELRADVDGQPQRRGPFTSFSRRLWLRKFCRCRTIGSPRTGLRVRRSARVSRAGDSGRQR